MLCCMLNKKQTKRGGIHVTMTAIITMLWIIQSYCGTCMKGKSKEKKLDEGALTRLTLRTTVELLCE